jgi:hypothetical protein
MKLRVRGTYGKPWSKLIGEGQAVTPAMLEQLGEVLVQSILDEARKDYLKQGGERTPHGKPEGIPGDRFVFKPRNNHQERAHFRSTHSTKRPYAAEGTFWDSWSYEIVGKSTVVVKSSWPWIEQILDGRGRFKMDWLTQAKGVKAVPIVQNDGTVIVRTAPKGTGDAWMHPGFAKHSFVERGIKKGRKKAAEIARREIIKALKKGDPFR